MTAKSPIEHVIVLTLENRSFDHMLGFLPRTGHLKTLNALDGTESNQIDSSDPQSAKISTKQGAIYEFYNNPLAAGSWGPEHGFPNAVVQQTGTSFQRGSAVGPVTNNGFVQSFASAGNIDPAHLQLVMEAFTPSQLPALSTLAQEFVLCDHWFSSVPGPTMPNRLYMHAATSFGYDYNHWSGPFPFDSIYNRLQDAGRSWRVYSTNFDVSHSFDKLAPYRSTNFPHFSRFVGDVNKGDLPEFSFIVPNFINGAPPSYGHADSQHAPTDVAHGEKLIADVYNAIRANDDLWKSTLLVVVYDEHGGFYDHVVPPAPVLSPDGISGRSYGFGFDRLGVRVPAILVSPWLPKLVDHTVYEHASLPATLKRFFGLGAYLTKRDAAANSFEGHLYGQDFRTDTPASLSYPPHAAAGTADSGSGPSDPIQRDIALGTLELEPDPDKRAAVRSMIEAGPTQRELAVMVHEIVKDHLNPSPGSGWD